MNLNDFYNSPPVAVKSPCELWKWSGEIGILKGNAVFGVHREAVYVCHKELEQIGIRESKSFNNGKGKGRQEGGVAI